MKEDNHLGIETLVAGCYQSDDIYGLLWGYTNLTAVTRIVIVSFFIIKYWMGSISLETLPRPTCITYLTWNNI